jgi:hypothetical protein
VHRMQLLWHSPIQPMVLAIITSAYAAARSRNDQAWTAARMLLMSNSGALGSAGLECCNGVN